VVVSAKCATHNEKPNFRCGELAELAMRGLGA